MMKNQIYEIPLRRIILPQYEDSVKFLKQIDTNGIYTNHGPLVQKLENSLAKKFNTNPQNIVITTNCTSSLQSILLNINNKIRKQGNFNINKEKKYYCILPSFTFVASAMSIIGSGLDPVFLDIDENSAQLTPKIVEEFFTKNVIDKKNIIAVMPVSPFGVRINKNAWKNFSRTHKIEIVYDEAWCFDSFVANEIGNSAISLHATKCFGCGEGGVVVANSSEEAFEFRKIINFGFDKNIPSDLIGLNGKMSEYSAAIALTALEKWPENKARCLELQRSYLDELNSFSKIKILKGFDSSFAWGTLPVIFENQVNIQEIISKAAANKIEFRNWWKHGVHEFVSMKQFPVYKLNNTITLTNRLINIPFYPSMTNTEVDKVCNELKKYDK